MDDKTYLQRLSDGDIEAFRLVCLRCAPRVESFALKILKNIREAQNVSQNVFAKIRLQRELFDGLRCIVRTELLGISAAARYLHPT